MRRWDSAVHPGDREIGARRGDALADHRDDLVERSVGDERLRQPCLGPVTACS
jgi:hypothetical protein